MTTNENAPDGLPSGRVATIDLQQAPEAIEDARNLLREFGDAVLIKEDGPRAGCNQPEGTKTNSEGNDPMASVQPLLSREESAGRKERAVRKQRAAHARPGTVAADWKITIEDAPLLDSIVVSRTSVRSPGQNRYNIEVSDLPLIIRQTSQGRRVRVWRTPDGRWWRKGGTVQIRRWAGEGGEHSNGERAFVLTLYKGANLDDLDYLRSFVNEARDEVSTSLWDRVDAGWADRETFHLDASSLYGDPHTLRDPSPGIWFCDDDDCPATWHLEHEDHEHDDISNDDYSIVIWKGREAASKWLLSITVDSCGLDARAASSLVNDIQWMQQTCDKLNAPAEVAA